MFFAHNAKGVVDVLGEAASSSEAVQPAPPANGAAPTANGSGPAAPSAHGNGRPAPHVNGSDPGAEDPQLSVIVPVWSRTAELAEMAARTIERVWEVARIPTEVIVVDNGSPFEWPFPARVHRYPMNRGVSTAWNTGINLARAPVIAAINSDCLVEPGWDEALHEAATAGRRIAFPYTDHCDGEGFRQPDQAGTAGWCFMLTQELCGGDRPLRRVVQPRIRRGHRLLAQGLGAGGRALAGPGRARHPCAAQLGQGGRPAEMLLLAHRYKYGWKHGVEPLPAPPYYNRVIVEYHGTQQPVPDADPVT